MFWLSKLLLISLIRIVLSNLVYLEKYSCLVFSSRIFYGVEVNEIYSNGFIINNLLINGSLEKLI